METWEKSKHIARILSNEVTVLVGGQLYYIKTPSRLQRHLAEEIYEEQYTRALNESVKGEGEINGFLGLFSKEDQKLLDALEGDLENLKVSLYNNRLQKMALVKIREALEMTAKEQERLYSIKHAYDHLTPQGIASSAKLRYLMGCSIYLEDFSPYWTKRSDWSAPDDIIDGVASEINKSRLSEKDFKEIARTDPWRGTWSIQKHCGDSIFPGSAFDLNDDQKSLLIWSSMYDSIREHPDNLPEEVVNDDDMLDGWMILKRREREKEQGRKSIENITDNEKIKNASEQFIFVDNIEDAKKVIDMNDYTSSMNFRERMAKIKEEGVVAEQNMPDSLLRIQQQRMEALSQQAGRK